MFARKHTREHKNFMPKRTGGALLRKYIVFSLFQATISKGCKDRLLFYRLTWKRNATTASLLQKCSQMESYSICEDASLLHNGSAGLGIAKTSAIQLEVCQVKWLTWKVAWTAVTDDREQDLYSDCVSKASFLSPSYTLTKQTSSNIILLQASLWDNPAALRRKKKTQQWFRNQGLKAPLRVCSSK